MPPPPFLPGKAMENFVYIVHSYTFDNLLSSYARAHQADGTFGVSAAY